MWYAQLVEGVRPDVTIAITPYLNADWFARHLVSDVDRIPPYVELQQPALFEHGQIRATIPPGLHLRDQLVVLQLIKTTSRGAPYTFPWAGTRVVSDCRTTW